MVKCVLVPLMDRKVCGPRNDAIMIEEMAQVLRKSASEDPAK